MLTLHLGSIMKTASVGLPRDPDPPGAGGARITRRPPRRIEHALAAIPAASLTLGLALWLACPPAALAALGGSADSAARDSTEMRGVLRSTSLVQYDVQEIDSGALTVREYVTLQGQVFAVTWQGPEMPNLRQLLGDYFGRFQTAAVAAHRASPGIHRQLSIVQSDLVVQSAGRLRDFHGVAYLPALVPQGVSVGALQ